MIQASEIINAVSGKKADLHLHSTFSDGSNSIEEMVKAAHDCGYEVIAITDHVRRNTDWLDDYIKEIERLRLKFSSIKIFAGIEVKAINFQGGIDAQKDFFDKIDFVVGVIHRVPKGDDEYFSFTESAQKDEIFHCWMRVMRGLLRNPQVIIIGHPMRALEKWGIELEDDAERELADLAAKEGKIFELNKKHGILSLRFQNNLKEAGVPLIPGSDSHNTQELLRWK